MSREVDAQRGQVRYLVTIIALVVAIAVAILFFSLSENDFATTLREFTAAIIPDIFVALIAVPVIFVLLRRRGILDEHDRNAEPEQADVETMGDVSGDLIEENNEVIRVYANFRTVDWAEVLASAKVIDAAVTYLDGWARANWDLLLEFFANGGQMHIVMTDPSITDQVAVANSRFKKYSAEDFNGKISRTVKVLAELIEDSGAPSTQLTVYYFPFAMNYAVIRIDDSQLFFSFYEHKQKKRIMAPSILFDLSKNKQLRSYWRDEFSELFSNSRIGWPANVG